jgi:hypothetical protein
MLSNIFGVPQSLIDKVNNILENKEVEESIINEVSPPGQEDWVKSNKAKFEKEYGSEKGKKILYSKAWKMHKEEKDLSDKKVLYEKGKKKPDEELDEREKVYMNPIVEPEKLASNSNKIMEPEKTKKF